MTTYQMYRTMSWTTDADECEDGCGKMMTEGSYVEGVYGHYCCRECMLDAECDGGPSWQDEACAERLQMGIV